MTALESLQTRLEADLSVVCGHLNVLHEQLVSITREALETAAWEGQGVNTPAAWLAWQTGLSPVRAREIVQIAQRQTELPHTFRAFKDGLLSVDQVAVVTKRVPAQNDREACELAQSATVAQLRVATSKHFLPPTPKPEPETPAAPAEPTHRVSVGFNDDGDFFLHGLVDSVDGAIINNALSEAKDALFQAGNTNVTWLDALREVCQRSLGTVTTPSRQDLYRTIIHLDTEGAWIHNGPAVPPALLERLCCSAARCNRCGKPTGYRSTSDAPGTSPRYAPGALSRTATGSAATPPVTPPAGLEVHHIIHWRNGGTTDTHNLCLLCDNHHDRHHKGEFSIHGNANDPNGLIFRDTNGRIIAGSGTPQPPGTDPPPQPAKPYAHPTGERMYLKWLDFTPPPASPHDNS